MSKFVPHLHVPRHHANEDGIASAILSWSASSGSGLAAVTAAAAAVNPPNDSPAALLLLQSSISMSLPLALPPALPLLATLKLSRLALPRLPALWQLL